jgi:hypothetical protein
VKMKAPYVVSHRYYGTLNELLKTSSGYGAYYMGAVTMLAVERDLEPDHQLLYTASRAVSLEACAVIFQRWKELQEERAK